jgi:tetratricopeptide (TPR) repeat protein
MKPDTIYKFVQELKRRRVFRGIIVYGASTLILLESADIIFNSFAIEAVPKWFVYLLAVGFLGSLWFSWIYDFTPGGIVKTEPAKDHPVPIPQQKLKTYRFTTFLSVFIIIGILSFKLIDDVALKKIESLEKKIAVLPLAADDLRPIEFPQFEFIGDEITSCLTKVRAYSVVPWEYTRKYPREGKDYKMMGEDLSAAILVNWKPFQVNLEFYLSIDLISVDDEKVLWSEKYKIHDNWSGSEIIRCSRKISKKITRELRTFLTLEERELISEVPVSPRASMYASLGSAMMSDSRDLANTGKELVDSLKSEYIDSVSFEKAIHYFTEAIQEDPNFAKAYANRAKARLWGMREGYFDQSILGDCETDISKAFKLDPELPEAIVAMGFYHYYGNDEYLLATVSFEKAVELRPDNSEYLFYLSLIWRRLGNWDMVQSLTEKVFESNPRNAVYQTNLGLSYLYLRDFSRSVECQDRAIDLIPQWIPPHLNKINALMWAGKISEARKAVREAGRITGKEFYRIVALLDFYEGQYDNAAKYIDLAKDIEFLNYGESEGDVFLLKAEIYRHAGSEKLANEYYIRAKDYFQNLVLFETDNYWAFSQLGLACAGAGMVQQAIGYGQQALDLIASEEDGLGYPYLHYNMIRIYAIAQQDESASNMIKEHLNIPSPFSLDFLKLDPDTQHLLVDPESPIY